MMIMKPIMIITIDIINNIIIIMNYNIKVLTTIKISTSS